MYTTQKLMNYYEYIWKSETKNKSKCYNMDR